MGVLQKIYERHAVKKKTELRDIGKELSIAWEKAVKAKLGGEDWIATQIDAVVEAMEALDGKKAGEEMKKFQKRLDSQIAEKGGSSESTEEPSEAPAENTALEEAMDNILLGKDEDEPEDEIEEEDDGDQPEAKGGKGEEEEKEEKEDKEEKESGEGESDEKKSEQKSESGEKKTGEKEPESGKSVPEDASDDGSDASSESESEEVGETGKTGENGPEEEEKESESEETPDAKDIDSPEAALKELKSRIEKYKQYVKNDVLAPLHTAYKTYEKFEKQIEPMHKRLKDVRKMYEQTKAVQARDEAAFYVPQYMQAKGAFAEWMPSNSAPGKQYQSLIDILMNRKSLAVLDLSSKLDKDGRKKLDKALKEEKHEWKDVNSGFKKLRKLAYSVDKDLYMCGCNIRACGHPQVG